MNKRRFFYAKVSLFLLKVWIFESIIIYLQAIFN